MSEILLLIMAVFAVIGALDRILGNRLGLGKEFEDGITATFSLTAQTSNVHRDIHIMCEHGEIHGDELDGSIKVTHFRRNRAEAENTRIISSNIKYESGHGGGDDGIMEDFTAGLQQQNTDSRSSISRSVESHLMACAIEQARITGTVVEMAQFRESLR